MHQAKLGVAVTASGTYQQALNLTNGTDADFQVKIQTSLTGIGPSTNTPLAFLTNATEKARISAAGGFSVGTTADPGAGAIYATGNITAYYSDDRLKTKLGGIENALDKVKALSGFYYEANETAQNLGYKVEKEVGVSAQEVQAVLPEIVVPAPIDEQYLTVRYERLVPLLIEAIKELEAKVVTIAQANNWQIIKRAVDVVDIDFSEINFLFISSDQPQLNFNGQTIVLSGTETNEAISELVTRPVENLKSNFTLKPGTGKNLILRSISGGTGCTTLAINLAFELAELGSQIHLVDFDINPVIAPYLGLRDLMKNPVKLLSNLQVSQANFSDLNSVS